MSDKWETNPRGTSDYVKQLESGKAMLLADVERLRAERDERIDIDKWMELLEEKEAELKQANAVVEAADWFAKIQRTRVWEDKKMNACGMYSGDSTDVHTLRKLEEALAALETEQEGK